MGDLLLEELPGCRSLVSVVVAPQPRKPEAHRKPEAGCSLC